MDHRFIPRKRIEHGRRVDPKTLNKNRRSKQATEQSNNRKESLPSSNRSPLRKTSERSRNEALRPKFRMGSKCKVSTNKFSSHTPTESELTPSQDSVSTHSSTPKQITYKNYSNRNSDRRSVNHSSPRYSGLVSWLDSFVFHVVRLSICLVLGAGFLLYLPPAAETDRVHEHDWGVGIEEISESLSSSVQNNEFPTTVQLKVEDELLDATLHYNFDSKIKANIDNLLNHYGPDYAAVVVANPKTGRILAMSSFVRDGEDVGNLSVHSGFPAASIFKMITAAAALDQDIASPSTQFEFNGKFTSLYKSNVLHHKKTKWTQIVSLTKAFARSINTVFGRLGIYDVGGETLAQYANRFGFNSPIVTDIPLDSSKTAFDPADEWSIAEAASGYTRKTTISPLHAVMLASAVVNDGLMIEPRIIEYAHFPNGPLVYEATPGTHRAISPETAQEMRVLMRQTVESGSARKVFKGFFKGQYENLDVGGKTGSLTGENPKGRTEWFVGYGDSGSDQITVAAVVVNKEKWRVKSSYLAKKVIEDYFKSPSSQG